ncbi:MAG: LPS-assembly protein LptD [Rhodobacteraceae bacterium]|nr:LPS-assembly protein LptD [Paracoccaceae bacterium]
MRQLLAYLWVMALSLAAPGAAQTVPGQEEPVSLVADQVSFDPGTGILTAQGNVNIFRGSRILRTEAVIFDQTRGMLTIPGPLIMADGSAVVTMANGARLDSDLRNGLIEGANILIAQHLQMSAKRFHRKDGNYKVLDRVVATTCHICAKHMVPFWQIRSRRVIHDEQARRLYFESATVDVLGVPVFHIPRLSVPDPTRNRASGFLVPQLKNSTLLGYSVAIPYYTVLGNHADFTLTPHVFTGGSVTLGLQYRQETRRGHYRIEGHVIAFDDLGSNPLRSSLSASGIFYLPRDVVLEFGVELASDKSVRDDYAIDDTGNNRLSSFITLSHTRANGFAGISAQATQSLRTKEVDTNIPVVLPEFFARKTWVAPYPGGKFGITAQSVTLLRDNRNRFSRISLIADWTRDRILRNGMVAEVYAGVHGNSYYTHNYAGFKDGSISNITPVGAIGLRYPLARQAGRVTHLVEPRFRVVWSPGDSRSTPNEDSTRLEFEDMNLFSLNRFPGYDRTERGLRAHVGVRYKRMDAEGWSLGLTVGRVIRESDSAHSSADTGLSGTLSDYVTATTFRWRDRIDFTSRTLFDTDFLVSKNETRLALTYDPVMADLSYLWLEQNGGAGASDRTHEASIGLEYRYNSFWTYSGRWHQNLETGNSTSGRFGIRYANECITLNLSYLLKFKGSGIARSTQELGFTVELARFGNKNRMKRRAGHCAAL